LDEIDEMRFGEEDKWKLSESNIFACFQIM
jgi:hypothetical protein